MNYKSCLLVKIDLYNQQIKKTQNDEDDYEDDDNDDIIKKVNNDYYYPIKRELIQFTIVNGTDCDLTLPLFQDNVYSINDTLDTGTR